MSPFSNCETTIIHLHSFNQAYYKKTKRFIKNDIFYRFGNTQYFGWTTVVFVVGSWYVWLNIKFSLNCSFWLNLAKYHKGFFKNVWETKQYLMRVISFLMFFSWFSDIDQKRLDFAKSMGADAIIKVASPDAKAIASQVEEVLGSLADVTIECSGAPPSIRTAIYVSCILKNNEILVNYSLWS